MRSGDEETAICHVCDQRFQTQGELLKHLEETHPSDLLPDVPETDQDWQEAIDGPDQDAQERPR
jgi:hypothetical protein